MCPRSRMREVRQQYSTGNSPASTLGEVLALAWADYLIEVEAWAPSEAAARPGGNQARSLKCGYHAPVRTPSRPADSR
jgi:hypothetical protein